MAARENGIVVPTRERPELRRYRVTGTGPRGPASVVVDGTDQYDALAEAKKIVRLNHMTAVEEPQEDAA